MKALILILLLLFVSCGNNSDPEAPTPIPTPEPDPLEYSGDHLTYRIYSTNNDDAIYVAYKDETNTLIELDVFTDEDTDEWTVDVPILVAGSGQDFYLYVERCTAGAGTYFVFIDDSDGVMAQGMGNSTGVCTTEFINILIL